MGLYVLGVSWWVVVELYCDDGKIVILAMHQFNCFYLFFHYASFDT